MDPPAAMRQVGFFLPPELDDAVIKRYTQGNVKSEGYTQRHGQEQSKIGLWQTHAHGCWHRYVTGTGTEYRKEQRIAHAETQ